MTTPINMLAIDLAKGSFQVCAIGLDGAVLYNRVLSRTRLVSLLAEQKSCIVAMEACATSHYWGRMAESHGHEVRLVPAVYVKPFVKRQKNDKADAEAIAEAASRPTMRFVSVKSAETQGRAVAFRTRQCLVRQRTQLINALRGHLAEFGLVAPKGPASLKVLETALADENSVLPGQVREMGAIYLDQIATLTEVIVRLANELEAASKTDDQLRRLLVIVLRDRPVRRAISRTDSFCRKCMRRMMFKSPMWITPVTPAAHRFGERFTWLNSQWKLRPYPAQFWVEINNIRH